jgi:hypothetical protein
VRNRQGHESLLVTRGLHVSLSSELTVPGGTLKTLLVIDKLFVLCGCESCAEGRLTLAPAWQLEVLAHFQEFAWCGSALQG